MIHYLRAVCVVFQFTLDKVHVNVFSKIFDHMVCIRDHVIIIYD